LINDSSTSRTAPQGYFFTNLFISFRPKQWYKNVLLLVGIVFSHHLSNTDLWIDVLLAMIYFCALSAGEYLINDILDKKYDQSHPGKRLRPIAAGKLKVSAAAIVAVGLIVLALTGAYFTINLNFFIICAAYVGLILLYSILLKHLFIIDIMVIASGFLIRAIAGCLAIDVTVSPWLIICAFLLALLLALGKRRQELTLLAGEATNHRASFNEYSVPVLDQFINITIGGLIISYLMYTFLTGNYYLMLTTPSAIYGLFRYAFLLYHRDLGGDPVDMLKDKAMLINIAVWCVLMVIIVYVLPPAQWI
jgi:4-hydroxybenzoate polyprenyltransferase